MRKAWQGILTFTGEAIGSVGCLLAIIGLPFTIIFALLFRPQCLRSSRPGKLGLEDVFRGFFSLAWKCGLVTAILAVIGLVFGR